MRSSSRPTLAQTALIIAASIGIAALLYSDWFNECCMDTGRGWLWIPLYPAMLVQLALAGGNIHGGHEAGFYFGLAVELYLLAWFARWLAKRWRRTK